MPRSARKKGESGIYHIVARATQKNRPPVFCSHCVIAILI